MLHSTASFEHEIADGAPAARFMKQFSELGESGDLLIPEEPGQKVRRQPQI